MTDRILYRKIVVHTIVVNTIIYREKNMSREFLPCVCLSARRAANALTAYYDKAFEDLGITTTQFSMMINIKSAGQIRIGDLAKTVKLEKSTLTRTLAPLIDAGYVHSQRGTNRREVMLSLTYKGKEIMSEAFPIWREKQKEMEDFLGGEKEAERFVNTLLKLQSLKMDDH